MEETRIALSSLMPSFWCKKDLRFKSLIGKKRSALNVLDTSACSPSTLGDTTLHITDFESSKNMKSIIVLRTV